MTTPQSNTEAFESVVFEYKDKKAKVHAFMRIDIAEGVYTCTLFENSVGKHPRHFAGQYKNEAQTLLEKITTTDNVEKNYWKLNVNLPCKNSSQAIGLVWFTRISPKRYWITVTKESKELSLGEFEKQRNIKLLRQKK